MKSYNTKKNRMIKIVILGDCFVGKSSILDRYINSKFSNNYKATLGLNFMTQDIFIDNKHYIINLWDTAGSERFRSVNTIFYRGADACILVFDQTNYQTFNNISFWYDEFLINTAPKKPDEFPFVLIGNKAELMDNTNLINEENKKRESINSQYDDITSSNLSYYKGIVKERMVINYCKDKNIKYFSVSAKDNDNIKEAIDYIINLAIQRVNNFEFEDDYNKISITDTITTSRCYCF